MLEEMLEADACVGDVNVAGWRNPVPSVVEEITYVMVGWLPGVGGCMDVKGWYPTR